MRKRRRQQVALGAQGEPITAGQRITWRPGDAEDVLYELPPTYARRPGTFEAADEGEEIAEACGCTSRVVGGRWRLVHVCSKR